jgi:hypothetical protein
MLTLLSLACPVSKPSPERSYRARQSHPKPLGVTRSKSAIYPRNRLRQSHFSYLKCFQYVSPSKGAFLSRKRVACVQAVPAATPVEPEHRGNRGLNSDVPARRHERSRRARPPSFSRWRPGEPSFDPRRPAPSPQALAYMDGLAWRKTPENTQKNIHTRKARISGGINNLSQKRGLHRKPECPLESIKGGLHRMRQRRRF